MMQGRGAVGGEDLNSRRMVPRANPPKGKAGSTRTSPTVHGVELSLIQGITPFGLKTGSREKGFHG